MRQAGEKVRGGLPWVRTEGYVSTERGERADDASAERGERADDASAERGERADDASA